MTKIAYKNKYDGRDWGILVEGVERGSVTVLPGRLLVQVEFDREPRCKVWSTDILGVDPAWNKLKAWVREEWRSRPPRRCAAYLGL